MPPHSPHTLPPPIGNDPELAALIRCLSVTLGTATPESAAKALAHPKLDWPKFIQKIQRHRLVQQLYSAIHFLPAGTLPADKLSQLQSFNNTFTLRQLAFTAQSRNALAALNESNIEALILKGPALANLLYGSPEKRECRDLDLLVRETDFHAAEIALASAGFRYNDPDAHLPGDRLARHKHHGYHLHYTNGKIGLELHWRISGLSFMHPFTNEELFARKQKFALANTPAASLGYDDIVQHQSIHGIAHGWNQLRLIYEIALTRKLDPARFDTIPERIKHPQAQRCFQISNTLVQQLFNYGQRAPSRGIKTYQKLATRILAREDISADKTITTLERSAAIFLAAYGPRNKLKYLKHLSSWTSLNHKLQLPKALQFLYPILGPLAWLKRQLLRSLGFKEKS